MVTPFEYKKAYFVTYVVKKKKKKITFVPKQIQRPRSIAHILLTKLLHSEHSASPPTYTSLPPCRDRYLQLLLTNGNTVAFSTLQGAKIASLGFAC